VKLMRQLLQFFALLTLRVLAVVTVIMWGASQMGSMHVVAPIGGPGVGVSTTSDGWGAGIAYQWAWGMQFHLSDRALTSREAFPLKSHVIGEQLWIISNGQRVGFGLSYIFTLILLFATYAAFWFFSRRRPRSLQSKLADAARLR